MPTLRKVLRENDFETFIEKIEKIENLKIAPFLLTVEPAYDEGTTEQRDTMRQEPERKPEPHPTRGETATPPALNVTKKQQTYGSGQRKEQKTRTPPSRTKGNIMKNNTFNQVINANLASIDPGFGQFALAKASADLFKKVINK